MSIFKEIPPTAGFPLYAKDLFSLFSKTNYLGCLEQDFKKYLGVPYARLSNSGTAAFYIILETLKRLSSKKTVIIPSFTCPLIPLAINRAGLNVAVCDINKNNFNFDITQLKELCFKNPDILAIVAVHLGGIPQDFSLIQQVAQENKIFIIEDCAQSLGAIYQAKKVGTLGEFSFFSLARGKGLTIYEGGIIATKEEEFCPELVATIKNLEKNDFFSESLKILELFGYWGFYRPKLFWFVFRLPQMFWQWQNKKLKAEGEYFSVDFPLHKVSKLREIIGHIKFWRLEKEIDSQRQKAFDYIKQLEDVKGLKIIRESPEAKASYPYLTLLFDNSQKRQKAQETFKNLGLGVAQIYAAAITDYDYLKSIIANTDSWNARSLAARHITLSTSTFLSKKDLNCIVEIIKNLDEQF